MQIRQVSTTGADQLSAVVFFRSLIAMYDTHALSALDAFARNGELTVKNYFQHVNKMECWELSEEHVKALGEFATHVVIGCSYRRAKIRMQEGRRYDMIVIDTPQGVHNDFEGKPACEHFDFLNMALQMMTDSGLIVLYVNKSPYDKSKVGDHGYDSYAEYDYDRWMKIREMYYGTSTITEEQAIETYRNVLSQYGYRIRTLLTVPCFSDVPGQDPYAFRLALDIERTH